MAHVRSPTPVVKVFFYLFGVDADGGCTGIVPGTHLLHAHPRDVVPEVIKDNYAMPNLQRLVMSPGGCVLIDTNIWHAALPNLGARERETVFLRYQDQ